MTASTGQLAPTNRMAPSEREIAVLAAALRVAERLGYDRCKREDIAKEAGISAGLVTKRLGTMVMMRRKLMRTAVKEGNLVIIAQGLAARDPQALKASEELRAAAARKLAKA